MGQDFHLQRHVQWFLSVSDRFLLSLSDGEYPPPFPDTLPILFIIYIITFSEISVLCHGAFIWHDRDQSVFD